MLISADPEEHRAYIQRFLDMGFNQVYLHNVGRDQARWIEVFGRDVLPKLHCVTAPTSRDGTDGAMRFGAQLWAQASPWAGFRDAAVAAEAAGWDALWTWDHLLAIQGPWQPADLRRLDGPCGVSPPSPSTDPVGPDGRREHVPQPGHTAKLATTLDHISDGRAVLGIGGAWFEREHDAFGIDFGAELRRAPRPARRGRRRSSAACSTARRSTTRAAYTFHDARLRAAAGPGPPADPDRRLRAEEDAAHGRAAAPTPGTRRARSRTWPRNADAILREHCAAVGRDPADDRAHGQLPDRHPRRPAEAARPRDRGAARATTAIAGDRPDVPILLGPPRRSPPSSARTVDLGFATVIVRLPAPYDAETIARIGEVRAALGGRPGQGLTACGSSRSPAASAGRSSRHGLQAVVGAELTVIVNTGDDLERHGLLVCPDHDTVMYTLAGIDDREQGWGIARRDVRRGGDARALRRGDLVPPRRPRPRRRTSSGPPASGPATAPDRGRASASSAALGRRRARSCR